MISFYPISNGSGGTRWQRQYFYQVINHNSIYDLGYIKFQINGSVRIFKILSDEAESLTLRTTGLWPYSNVGPNQLVTLVATGESESFVINDYKKGNMLNGFDDIDYLKNIEGEITSFAEKRPF